ncbi:LysM domain-containing protein [Labedella populi]|uniref:LysM domain-containing protein n=1 Tax=Labedella populi TaxID=2498850 RepID=A0A3S4B1X9_9MICO|nr:LysM domain-containing protein [Labedella populi]RWZ61072.1 LysM domain-containing protein [Labedella populi]
MQWNAEQDEGVLASPDWPEATDPSYIDSLVILDEASDPDENGCRSPVAARVDIAWTMPEVRPGLAVVAGDIIPNAAGEIALEDGVPASYTVVSRDTLDAVARRLGITPEDVLFLNPARLNDTATQRSELVAGERLNLVLARR